MAVYHIKPQYNALRYAALLSETGGTHLSVPREEGVENRWVDFESERCSQSTTMLFNLNATLHYINVGQLKFHSYIIVFFNREKKIPFQVSPDHVSGISNFYLQ